MLSETTWWGAAVSGSAEVRPSASMERNEGGTHSHKHTNIRTQVKSFTEQQREQDSCVHLIAQVNASLTHRNTLKCGKSKLDIKPK